MQKDVAGCALIQTAIYYVVGWGVGESHIYCLRLPTEIGGRRVLKVQLLTVAYDRHSMVGLIN